MLQSLLSRYKDGGFQLGDIDFVGLGHAVVFFADHLHMADQFASDKEKLVEVRKNISNG